MSGSQVKGTVMQTGKVLIIDRLRVSKVQYPENFAIQLFIILPQYNREIC